MKNKYQIKIKNFLKNIYYNPEDELEIMRRIKLKGLYIFEKIFAFLNNLNYENISYDIMFSVYIYEKKLRTILFKYFSFIEDYFRSELFEYYENHFIEGNKKRVEKVLSLHLIDLINEYIKITNKEFSFKKELNKLRNNVYHSKFILINQKNELDTEAIDTIKKICTIIEDDEIKNEYIKEINSLAKFKRDTKYTFSNFKVPHEIIINLS